MLSLLTLLAPSALATPIYVAIENGSSTYASATELAAQLNDDTHFDFTATVVTASQIDSASELANYDVVILGDSGHNQVDWTQAMADALVTWTQAGGGVVSVGWVDWVTGPGANVLTAIDNVQPIDSYSYHYGFYYNGATITISSTSHPVTDGLPSSLAADAAYIEGSPSACDATNCLVLGTSTGGSNSGSGSRSIVVGEYGSGRTVFLGQLFMARTTYSNSGLRTGDADQLLEQAVAWAADSIDTDGDGIADSRDNCPDDANASQTDSDNDGVGDVCDECDGDDAYGDADGDLECADIDCDDSDAAINSSATEICDGVDNDCDGDTDDEDASVDLSTGSTWYLDSDADGFGLSSSTDLACDQPSGYVADSSDCDDSDNAINPDATEICDGVDNDCDSAIDDADASVDLSTGSTWYDDDDGDGFGDPNDADLTCDQPTGHVSNNTDCDDSNSAINTSATEVCDGVDNDCDNAIDDADSSLDSSTATTRYADLDGDGYGDNNVSDLSCDAPSDYITTLGDCDDSDAAINPDATEICDAVDNDCDGDVDDADSDVDLSTGSTWYADLDGDGYGDLNNTLASCDQPSGYLTDTTDCDDGDPGSFPGAAEIAYDGIDQNCDGYDLCDVDEDGYDYLDCGGDDCDDEDAAIHVDAEEVYYDGIDQNCDGLSDYDADGDGFDSDQYEGDDCDDANDTVYPGAPEIVDGLDNDCNGVVEDDDDDGDGLSNGEELEIGTDPSNPDSDGDGLSDGYEVGGDTGAPQDSDADGLIDALDPDDDNDGIGTADEAGDDPSAPRDTDGDGVPDYLDEDSDGDGALDVDEGTEDLDCDDIPNYIDAVDDDGPCADVGVNDDTGVDGDYKGGCDCSSAPSPGAFGGLGLLLLGLVGLRRRR